MTSTNTAVELVQSLYAAFGRGDIAYIMERVTPDCEWIAPGPGLPSAGTYRGPQGVGEFFAKLKATENITHFEPREFYSDGGNNVVALGSEACTVLSTGKPAKTNWCMVFRLRAGKVAYWESQFDTLAYYKAYQTEPRA